MAMPELRYHDEPRCMLCGHPRVVHHGEDHDGRCHAISCVCKSYRVRLEVS